MSQDHAVALQPGQPSKTPSQKNQQQQQQQQQKLNVFYLRKDTEKLFWDRGPAALTGSPKAIEIKK